MSMLLKDGATLAPLKLILASLTTLLLALGCSSQVSSPTDDRLYRQLGGQEGIADLVYDLLVEIAADERVVDRFRDVNIERFRLGFETYLCSLTGGPCEYTGESMQVIHAGHNYTDVEFNAIVDNLITAMENNALPVPVQNRLLALLAPSYADIVYQ